MENRTKHIIFSHPTGNANSRAVLESLDNAGMLHSFHTTIAVFSTSFWNTLSKFPGLHDLGRRAYPDKVAKKTKAYPFRELMRMLCNKLKWEKGCKQEAAAFSVFSIYKNIDAQVARHIAKHPSINAVYAYEDGALASFRQAKGMGKTCLYDLPIGYWRTMHQLLEIEKHKNPGWAVTLGGFSDTETKLQRKEEELRLANHIFVASSFTKKTLESFPGDLCPIHVIPYGFPPVNKNRQYRPAQNRKLKVLYVGGLSQRKGISYLFEAVESLKNDLELTVVGSGNIEQCPALKTALAKHNYIPSLPHHKVLKLMSEFDVFVFPSLFEGFGMVITEAMSQGTPVITTERTCGPDVITHGVDGWLVEAGNLQALQNQLKELVDQPGRCETAGKNARMKAEKRPWDVYGKETVSIIEKVA
ncbi:MAG: glycosyltransferase family 4 protein [Edaphocola sp.]